MEAQSVLDQPKDRKVWRFLRHLLEMIVVMMLGMCVLGVAWGRSTRSSSAAPSLTPGAITSGWPPSRWPST